MEMVKDDEREPVLDVSDHVKRILDTFICDLGSFFESLSIGILIEAKDVERILETIASNEPVPEQNTKPVSVSKTKETMKER